MTADNPYRDFVAGFARLLAEGAKLGAAADTPPPRPAVAAGAAKALIFAPHPDDEVIVGALPLRLMRELGVEVVDVAVTLGSRRDRRAARRAELEACCRRIGFGLAHPAPDGLDDVNLAGRERDPRSWQHSVAAIARVLAAHRPAIAFMPHADDWNVTHIGVHHLVLEAMQAVPGFACQVVETEFWGAMDRPNLMVESSIDEVADLIAALSLHAGEVARNPYHLRLPGWMIDNVRRGAELVGGQGGAAPRFPFATLYRLRRFADGRLHEALEGGRIVASGDSLADLFPVATETGRG
jgi:LmbE family N-acetylglucosaminyl deacetylase